MTDCADTKPTLLIPHYPLSRQVKILVFLYFCWFFQKLIHCALLMAPARNVTSCYGQKARHRFCDSYPCFGFPQGGVPRRGKLVPGETGVFSDRNLSKWPLDRRFTVFSQKKRLHISSVQDTIIDVRVGFLVCQKTVVSHIVSL